MKKFIAGFLGMLIILNMLLIYNVSNSDESKIIYVPVSESGESVPAPRLLLGYTGTDTLPGDTEPVLLQMKNISKFGSFDEILDYLGPNANGTSYYNNYNYGGIEMDQIAVADSSSGSLFMKPGISVAERSSFSGSAGADYSSTNIQVVGVDEGDIVKNDGKYAYIVSENRTHVNVCDVYPVKSARLIGQIAAEGSIVDMYLNSGQLIVIEQDYNYVEAYEGASYQVPSDPAVIIRSWDITDKVNILQLNTATVNGSYTTSRIIGDYIYVIASQSTRGIEENMLAVPANMTYYTETEDYGYNFNNFLSMNISDYSEEASVHSILMGTSQTVFVSLNSIFMTGQESYYNEDGESTRIYKLALLKNSIGYVGESNAPGRVLNRYSMDEFAGNFRIATTKGHVSRNDESSAVNQIYIFGPEMNEIGKIENIAPGERIYSARFIGERAYLVTFKKVDPFFVIDLADPENPTILGELKIPGYSDYLHPYDENHIIGIGKDTIESDSGNFAWYQGIKIALFDVTDVTNPVEKSKFVIGQRGSDSLALRDPHAFLFDLEKNLLVIPVTVYEGSNNYYGNQDRWVGAYVFRISPEEGIKLEAKIQHDPDPVIEYPDNNGYYMYWNANEIKRSFYIGDVLYTVSGSMIKGNSLDDYNEVMEIEFGD